MNRNKLSTRAVAVKFVSGVPPTPAETAAAVACWERRGILGRLVRLEEPQIAFQEPQIAFHGIAS
jgi:hypothetical protein